MKIQNRLLRIEYHAQHQVLIASDVKGRVHKFDQQLNLVQSSPVTSYAHPVNSICLTEKYIFTKDRFGNIGKWGMESLEPLDFFDGRHICDKSKLFPEEKPSLSPNRGIRVFNGKLFTSNAYNQFVVLDEETFEVLDIRDSPSKTFIDCICTEHPDVHAMTDVNGKIFIGNIETNEWPVEQVVDTMVVHGIAYDKRHDRFWTTQDGGIGDDRFVRTGVTVIEKDGSGFKEFKVSTEDNEFIAFSPDHRTLFVGGFNGTISVFDNTDKQFRLKKVLGPMGFQIIHGAVVDEDQLYVLLQTGDVIRLNGDGEEVCRAEHSNLCVWTMEPHPKDDSLLYLGTDQGVSLIKYGNGEYGSIQIDQIAKHVHGFGVTKDVKPLPDGSYVCISRNGNVIKADEQGSIQWFRQVLGIPRGIALNRDYDRCLVSTDAGTVWELDLDDGCVIDQIEVGAPSYGCIYTDDGQRVVSVDKHSQIRFYPADSQQMLGAIKDFSYRIKRMIRASNGGIFVTGPDGVFELDVENMAIKKQFGEHLVSTKENMVLINGYVYAGGYGYQIGSYRYETGQTVDLKETEPDFTKAFAARQQKDQLPILLVGGRGGFINAYKIIAGIPSKVREFYIS